MNLLTFELTKPHIALCDLLKLTGVADSGGQGKAMVAAGLVKVDGKIELRKTAKILTGQRVETADIMIEVQ